MPRSLGAPRAPGLCLVRLVLARPEKGQGGAQSPRHGAMDDSAYPHSIISLRFRNWRLMFPFYSEPYCTSHSITMVRAIVIPYTVYSAGDSEMVDYNNTYTHDANRYSHPVVANHPIAIFTISVVLYFQCAVPMLLGPTRWRSDIGCSVLLLWTYSWWTEVTCVGVLRPILRMLGQVPIPRAHALAPPMVWVPSRTLRSNSNTSWLSLEFCFFTK